MTISILDRVARRRATNRFRPNSAQQFFALRLAQHLGEPEVASHYAELGARHSQDTLLAAYRRAVAHGHPSGDLGRRFHAELASLTARDPQVRTERLMAVKVDRRSVAAAVFVGDQLDFSEVRCLSSTPAKAEESALAFLSWVMSNCEVESVAVERVAIRDPTRRTALNETVLALFRASAIPVWEVASADLLASYGHPPLPSRRELRVTARSIFWAVLRDDDPVSQELDSAALGLHVQTERLFLF